MTTRAILRIGNGLFVGRGLDFQTLDCFRMNEFCIYTLGRNIRHLTVVGVALDKALDDTLAAVPDPVIVEASEKYRKVAGVDDVKVFRGILTCGVFRECPYSVPLRQVHQLPRGLR